MKVPGFGRDADNRSDALKREAIAVRRSSPKKAPLWGKRKTPALGGRAGVFQPSGLGLGDGVARTLFQLRYREIVPKNISIIVRDRTRYRQTRAQPPLP